MGGPNPAGATPADYLYDVFISYRRQYPVGPWVQAYLMELLPGRLNEELPRNSAVFLDTADIQPGDHFPARLATALRLSRCLVPVWSPSYFRSSYCLSEWQSFRERERLTTQRGLIVPILFNGRNKFPPEAQTVEMCDLSEYTSTMPGFRVTGPAAVFENKVKEFAQELALRIAQAPSYQTGWPVVGAIADAAEPHVELARLTPAVA